MRPADDQGEHDDEVDVARAPVLEDVAQLVVLLVDVPGHLEAEAGEAEGEICRQQVSQ